MGSSNFYPEEAPVRRVPLEGFWIAATPVTNRQYTEFVAATGCRTVAEVAPDPAQYPDMIPEMAQPESLIFHKAVTPVDTGNPGQLVRFDFGADWCHRLGPDSDIDRLCLWDHPVAQVAYADALAYAAWAGKGLPTEVEFEFAARGGLDGRGLCLGRRTGRR